MMQNGGGFTLAEVLVTLAIIGVVAAMTIPNLMANNAKAQHLVQIKKFYSEMGQAVKLLEVDDGVNKVTDTDWLYWDASETKDEAVAKEGLFLKKYFKIAKDCGTEFPSPCFADSYTNLNGTDTDAHLEAYNPSYSVITADGMSVVMGFYNPGNPPEVLVDTNGPKKPNVSGRDVFSFTIYYDGSMDESVNPSWDIATKEQYRTNRFAAYCNGGCAYAGAGCLGKILNDGWKMDY